MRPLAATLPVLLCAAACGEPADPADDTAASTSAAETTSGTTAAAEETTVDVPTGEPQDGPTYWQDVAPIYFKSCVTCHGDGGIGPFRLDNYADARQWAGAAAASTGVRSMPPWLIPAAAAALILVLIGLRVMLSRSGPKGRRKLWPTSLPLKTKPASSILTLSSPPPGSASAMNASPPCPRS